MTTCSSDIVCAYALTHPLRQAAPAAVNVAVGTRLTRAAFAPRS